MLQDWYESYRLNVETTITHFFDEYLSRIETPEEKRIYEVIRYAIGTKNHRLRPILAMIAYEELIGLPWDVILPYLIWLEFLHVSTYMQDDLPMLSNNEMRRGELTVWKKYDHATATLALSALRLMGIESLAESNQVNVIIEVVRAIGGQGIIRWQIREILDEHPIVDQKEMIKLLDEKTGKFIESSLLVGSLLAGVESWEVFEQLQWFGVLLGRAYQVREDIIRFESTPSGEKPMPLDDISRKKGIVEIIGLENTRKLLQDLEYALIDITNSFQTSKFADVVEYVVSREK